MAKKRRTYTHLKVKQVDEIKEILLAEKERIMNNSLMDKSKFCLDKNELADPLDEATANIQASQELRFRNRENFYLKKIDKTLALIDNKDFGECHECGCEIGFERLKARPTANQCITCKEEAETMEKNNYFDKRSKSLGKTLSEMTSK